MWWVLNLIINGLPSKHERLLEIYKNINVLNLIINGLPSKLSLVKNIGIGVAGGFKPYYKWITF